MAENIKDEIASQLLNLAEKKSFDKITVKELVNVCGISRQTFYYYYQDILDVIEYSISRDMEKNLEKGLAMDDEYQCIYQFMLDVEGHKAMIAHLLDSKLRAEVESLFLNSVRRMVEKVMNEKGNEITLKRQERKFVIDFFSRAIVGMIIANCHNTQSDPEQFSKMIYHLMQKDQCTNQAA